MFISGRHLIPILVLVAFVISSDVATAQDALQESSSLVSRFETVVIMRDHSESSNGFSSRQQADPTGGQNRTRQAFLLSGVAVSMLGYGVFALKFNNSRNDSEQARLAYEADVSENAQFYVDEGIALDEIPTYFAWEEAYTDAANARELVTLAGLSAFLLGLAAILDAATNANDQSSDAHARTVTPLLGVSPSSGDVVLGARIGL